MSENKDVPVNQPPMYHGVWFLKHVLGGVQTLEDAVELLAGEAAHLAEMSANNVWLEHTTGNCAYEGTPHFHLATNDAGAAQMYGLCDGNGKVPQGIEDAQKAFLKGERLKPILDIDPDEGRLNLHKELQKKNRENTQKKHPTRDKVTAGKLSEPLATYLVECGVDEISKVPDSVLEDVRHILLNAVGDTPVFPGGATHAEYLFNLAKIVLSRCKPIETHNPAATAPEQAKANKTQLSEEMKKLQEEDALWRKNLAPSTNNYLFIGPAMNAFASSWKTQHPGHNIAFRAKEGTLTTSICHDIKEATCVGVGPSWIDALSKTIAAFEDSSKKSASKADEPDQRTTSKSLNEWAREVHCALSAIGLDITDIESVVRTKGKYNEFVVRTKSKYNESRRYKHGGKKA